MILQQPFEVGFGLIYCDLYPAPPFRRLDDHGHRHAAMPFEGVGFAGSLADESLPVHICLDMGIAVSAAHPTDDCVRVDGDGVAGLYVAERDRVAVCQDGDIGVAAFSGKRGGCKSLLGEYAYADEADAVFAVLGECKDVLGFYGDNFTDPEFVDQDMLCIAGIVGLRVPAHGNLHKRDILSRNTPGYGAEDSLRQVGLRPQEDFFKTVVGVAGAVSGDIRSGFGEENVISRTGNLKS